MKKSKIDLSDIKEKDIENTATFTDLVSKKEKKVNDDIEDMINEKKRNTKDLTKEVKIAKEKVKEDLNTTKVFEINDDKKIIKEKKVADDKNNKKRDNKPTGITDIGIFILAVISYFIYCLLYTNFYDNKKILLINIITIIVIFLLYAFSILFDRKISRIIIITIFIILTGFIAFNLINSLGIKII